MDSIFTLSYPEYTVAIELQKIFKKKDGFSVSIPLSRQQKGFDLLLYNNKSQKSARIQIKSSRSYWDAKSKIWASWFNKFDLGLADFYFLFWLMPDEEKVGDYKLIKSEKNRHWKNITLVFSSDEMKEFFRKAVNKKGRPDSHFGFGFDNSKNKIFLLRPANNKADFKRYILSKKISGIKKIIK